MQRTAIIITRCIVWSPVSTPSPLLLSFTFVSRCSLFSSPPPFLSRFLLVFFFFLPSQAFSFPSSLSFHTLFPPPPPPWYFGFCPSFLFLSHITRPSSPSLIVISFPPLSSQFFCHFFLFRFYTFPSTSVEAKARNFILPLSCIFHLPFSGHQRTS